MSGRFTIFPEQVSYLVHYTRCCDGGGVGGGGGGTYQELRYSRASEILSYPKIRAVSYILGYTCNFVPIDTCKSKHITSISDPV